MSKGKVIPIEKVFLNNREAQEYLGVSADFMQDLRSHAEIKYSKIGKMIWYEKKDIDKLIKSNRVI